MEILPLQPSIERLLTTSLGGPVRLVGGMALKEREHVARFLVVDGPPGCPAALIAKCWHGREGDAYDPESTDPRAPSARLFDDWAGLQFLNETMGAASPAPRLIAGDRERGYFIMEDIGSGLNPAQALLGSDPALAENQMIELAAGLGRMHAATVGRKAAYDRIRSGLGPLAPSNEGRIRQLAARWMGSLEQLGVPLSSSARLDLERALHSASNPGPPGPFLAYTHGDPCPDNWLVTEGKQRLFDFEGGGFRNALMDGVYGRIHFPTCWCVNRFPPAIPEAMERVYRAELVKGCPEAANDRLFYPAVVEMCAFWVIKTCEEGTALLDLMDSDHTWGISTVRQRVLLRTGIFAELAASLGHLEAVGAAVASLAAVLRARWPAEAGQMPLYPAFAASGTLTRSENYPWPA